MTNAPVKKKADDLQPIDEQMIFVVNKTTGKKVVRFLILIAGIALCIRLLPFIKSIFPALGISFIFSFLLSPLVDRIENLGLSRSAAISILFLILAAIIVVSIIFFIPSLSQELSSISATVQTQNSDTLITKLQTLLTQQLPILKNPEFSRIVSTKLHEMFTALMQKSMNLVFAIVSSFTMIITLPFITFFMLKDGQEMKKYLIQKVPNRYFEMSLNLLYKTNKQLGNYIRGQLLVSGVIGTLAVIALYSLHVPYFFVIGIVAGLANLIPYFGPIVGALPAILVVVIETGSFGSVLGVIIAFAIIQLLDNVFVSPFIVSKSVHIHPMTVILVILVGGQVGGIIGMLISVPIFAVAQVVTKEIIWSFQHYRLLG